MKIQIDPQVLYDLCYQKFMYETTKEEACWTTFLNILVSAGYNKDTDVLFLDEGYYMRTE